MIRTTVGKTCLPRSHLGRVRRYPSRQRMDSPASCATDGAVPTANESNHSAAATLHPHRSATCVLYVRLTSCCVISIFQKKEICPFPNWRYKPPLKQWKMTIAYNSAYVQTKTLNFHLRPASRYCVFLCLLQLPRHHYAERQILMYKPIIFWILSDCTLIASKHE